MHTPGNKCQVGAGRCHDNARYIPFCGVQGKELHPLLVWHVWQVLGPGLADTILMHSCAPALSVHPPYLSRLAPSPARSKSSTVCAVGGAGQMVVLVSPPACNYLPTSKWESNLFVKWSLSGKGQPDKPLLYTIRSDLD